MIRSNGGPNRIWIRPLSVIQPGFPSPANSRSAVSRRLKYSLLNSFSSEYGSGSRRFQNSAMKASRCDAGSSRKIFSSDRVMM